MRSVELKLSAGRLDAKYLLAPGCSKSFSRIPVLVVEDAPDDVTDAEVERLVNETLINAPARPKEPPTVAFSRLGFGKIVNLVIGRPPVPEEQRKDVQVVTVRIEGAERRAKFRRLGREWLEDEIDRAKEPS